MSPATTHGSGTSQRDRVDDMLDRGESFEHVEDVVSRTDLLDDQRDALWLYAWTRSNLGEREARRRRKSMVASTVSALRHLRR
jgi:hypothetical protein